MSSTDPNLGLNYGWTLGESGWTRVATRVVMHQFSITHSNLE